MRYTQVRVIRSMYTAFYGLREKPFALSPDPRFLFLADSHREALAHLLYGIDQGEGFIAVTGEVGTGKTTICRTLLERLGSETSVAFLFNPSESASELLRSIAVEFGLPCESRRRGELGDDLNRFLLEEKREGRRALLIIDEAQNLSAGTLEQVRLLSNLETASSKLIQIILLGQPELDRKLDSPSLRQLRQRISVRWALLPMSATETREYVRHRLRVSAGAARELFSEGALREIYRRTRGIPRLVNVLCDRALLAGYGEQVHRVGAHLVRQCAHEIPDLARRRGGRSSPRARRVGWGAVAALGGSCALGALVFGGVVGLPVGGVDRWLDGAAPPAIEVGIGFGAVSSPSPTGALELAQSAGLGARAPDPTPASSVHQPEGEARGTLLGAMLEIQDATALRTRAVREVLSSYDLDDSSSSPASSTQEALTAFAEHGLTVLALEGVDFDTLRSLNHPVLLELRGEFGSRRLVAMLGLEAELVTVYALVDGTPLRLPRREVEAQWQGEAYVVWRDHEPNPRIIAPGANRAAVLWLQAALSELGLYSGEISGRFDQSTREGVRHLQLTRHLEPDGAVGPLTKMVLYDLLGEYAVPRLANLEGPG
ncbi:MAG: AAA family ATPase [Myxococcota bacterium]